ncbi:hypothetical protein WAI453_002609 [Rhynchosporium graminicola]
MTMIYFLLDVLIQDETYAPVLPVNKARRLTTKPITRLCAPNTRSGMSISNQQRELSPIQSAAKKGWDSVFSQLPFLPSPAPRVPSSVDGGMPSLRRFEANDCKPIPESRFPPFFDHDPVLGDPRQKIPFEQQEYLFQDFNNSEQVCGNSVIDDVKSKSSD